MANINVHLDDDTFYTFRKIKDILKCKTNEEAIRKLIDISQTHLQQQFLNNINSTPPANGKKKSSS